MAGLIEVQGVRVELDQGAIEEMFASKAGPVAKTIARKTTAVERKAKNLCPVDTGRLRASISQHLESEGTALVGIVGTNVDYAVFVEFGTRYMRAQPFLLPALKTVGVS